MPAKKKKSVKKAQSVRFVLDGRWTYPFLRRHLTEASRYATRTSLLLSEAADHAGYTDDKNVEKYTAHAIKQMAIAFEKVVEAGRLELGGYYVDVPSKKKSSK